jgi:hypothetical protein
VRQPSISSQNKGLKECAEMICAMMQEVGIDARVLSTGGQPVVFGYYKSRDAQKTLLIYNHYDVQPVEPLDAWEQPPFEARMIGDRIVGEAQALPNMFAQTITTRGIVTISTWWKIFSTQSGCLVSRKQPLTDP